jgi:hypothetical protein
MSATIVPPKSGHASSRNGKGQKGHDTHIVCALPVDLGPAQSATETRSPHGGGALSHRAVDTHNTAAEGELTGRQGPSEAHRTAASDAAPEAHRRAGLQTVGGSGAAALLALTAATLDDLERTRIATQNRLRAMRDDQGLGDTPEYQAIAGLYDGLVLAEHQAELTLKRALRKHPLHKWVKSTVGVGEKQAARLLAAVDDPTWNYRDDRPRRGPAEFWQYCGHGDPERSRRRKGQRVEFSPAAKMRTHLIAESCIKQMHSPYRAVYDQARAAWADRDTSDGHKHNHALRLVGKALLRDLFLAAKESSA